MPIQTVSITGKGNGSYTATNLHPKALQGVCSVSFYNKQGQIGMPPRGTITFFISEDGTNWGTLVGGAITFPQPDGYVRPTFAGYAQHCKVVLEGFEGALNFTARFHIQ